MSTRFVRRGSAAVRPATALAVFGTLLAGCAPAERAVAPDLQPGGPRLNVAAAAAPKVVISQVYGGGGNAGATLRNDYIELFNAGDAPQSLAGWSVQYASSAGTTWQKTDLTGTIEPGRYYLVRQALGSGGTVDLPTPDASGSIAMAAGAGKVALVSSTTALTGTCPTGLVDLVGFGTANCFEGSAGTPTLSNTTAAIRAAAGCKDTNDNASDFTAAAPAPRNSATTASPCAVTPPVSVNVAVTASATAFGIGQTTTLTAVVTQNGTSVTPTAVTWSAAPVGGVTFEDASVNPATATGAAIGPVTVTATATVGGQTYTGTLDLTVTAPPAPPSTIRISEFHYDNEGADEGEAIEVEGEAGQSLAGWSLVLYNRTLNSSSAQAYLTIPLTGTFASACNGRGVLTFAVPAEIGLQNGANDGIALVNAAQQVVELLSYEGSFTATEGPAAGMTATDVGVVEGSGTQAVLSLQRAGNGTWFGPANESFGLCNPAEPPTVLVEGYSFRGAAPIPVGFGEYYRFRDLTSGSYLRSGVTWTTTDAAVATVDAIGNVTATGVGSAFVRATETATGRTAATRVVVTQFGPVDESFYADELQFGVPTDANPGDDLVVNRATFAASFSAARGQPNWVAYNLEQTHRTGAVDRCDCFAPDPLLPAGTPAVLSSDYDGSGFSRGHMTMSADRTRGGLDNAQTFYFSNIIPQTTANNSGPWLALENYLGGLAAAGQKEIFVFAGGAKYEGTLNGAGRVAIPTRTWKVAVIVDRNEGLSSVQSPTDVEIIAVDMPNATSMPSSNWQTYRVTVDSIEKLTGYDLLSALPNLIEGIVESNDRKPTAAITGTDWTGRLVGETLTFSGATSSDPDAGDVLSYLWSTGGTNVGIAPTLSYAFATAGTKEVRLIVADQLGYADTAAVAFTILSAAQGFDLLRTQVATLENATTATGKLDRGEFTALQQKLDAAARKLRDGNGKAASVIVNSLVEQLRELVADGSISSAQAQPVIDYAVRVSRSLAL